VAHDTAVLEKLPDCAWLKSGIAVDITRTFGSFAGAHPIGARMYGNGTFADGYMLREGLEPSR